MVKMTRDRCPLSIADQAPGHEMRRRRTERRFAVNQASVASVVTGKIGVSLAGSVVVAPVVASAAVGIDINVAPPAPRVEVVPPPRPGYVWAPGFYEWRGGAHVWVPGRWMGERHGYHWVPDRWEQRGDHWHHWRGHWER
jgi:hypothetical protein